MTAPPTRRKRRATRPLDALGSVGALAVALAMLAPGLAPEPLRADPPVDPTDVDSDGLPDAQEHVLGTSQYVADTDGDGYVDSLELALGSRPSDAGSTPLLTTGGELRVGMSARGERGFLRLHLALYSENGDFQTSVLRLGALAGGQVVSVPFHRFLPMATIRDVPVGAGAVRTVDLELSPTYVNVFGAATFFVAVGAQGTTSYHSAAKVDLYSVDQTLLLRREPSAATQQGTPSGGGSLRQPIPTTGTGGIPATWTAGQICYQRSSVTGIVGPKVVHEITSANCLSGWDTFCPTDCASSVGGTYETIDPATLIGG